MKDKIIKSIKKFEIETGVKPTHINVRKEEKEELKQLLGVTENEFEGLEIVEDLEIIPRAISLSKGIAKNREINYMEKRMIEK